MGVGSGMTTEEKAEVLGFMMAHAALIDLDHRLLTLRRALNSTAGHLRKAGKHDGPWSQTSVRQLLKSSSKGFHESALHIQACRDMLKTANDSMNPLLQSVLRSIPNK